VNTYDYWDMVFDSDMPWRSLVANHCLIRKRQTSSPSQMLKLEPCVWHLILDRFLVPFQIAKATQEERKRKKLFHGG
jgi:hypothetical protein